MTDSMTFCAGVDLGGTLTKIAVRREGAYGLHTLPSAALDEVVALLRHEGVERLALTGGGSVKHRAAFDHFQVVAPDEFKANIAGADHLLGMDGGARYPYALASVGTGTSVSIVDADGGQRVAGTAVGGGAILGLGRALTGEVEFDRILARCGEGDRSRVDLRVVDVYGTDLPGLPGEATAANFGKVLPSASADDLGRAMLQMVGEVVAVVASLVGASIQAREVVYVGASLRGNPILVEVLGSTTRFMGQQPRFVANGEYAGAIGAAMHCQ